MGTLDLQAIVTGALFIGVRVGGLILFAPFFGGQTLPAAVKVALTVALTALLYPVYRPAVRGSDVLAWVGIVAGELIVGLLLGMAVQFVLEAAQMAGHLIGVQAGYSLVTLLDPQTQADTPVIGTFNQLIATLIFLQLNIHHWLLRGLAATFSYLPSGSVLSNLKAGGDLLRAAGGIWLVGVQMAAPVVVATLLVDVSLGFLAKAAPQMPVLFVGLSIKTMLSLLILGITMAWWPALLEHHFAAGLSLGERLLHLAR
jgi:flagellar biosynthetic protein FliR